MTLVEAWYVILRWWTVFAAVMPLLMLPLGGGGLWIGVVAVFLFLIWLKKKGILIFCWLVAATFLFAGLMGLGLVFQHSDKPVPSWFNPKPWAPYAFILYTAAGVAVLWTFLRMKQRFVRTHGDLTKSSSGPASPAAED